MEPLLRLRRRSGSIVRGNRDRVRWQRTLSLALLTLVALAPIHVAQAGTMVEFNVAGVDGTVFGKYDIDLFDDLTPNTVTNFLHYITSGEYNNSMIHRVDTGVGVIQGGGFDTQGNDLNTFPAIPLEYSRANTRGTISMARTSDVNSATSQWFINTVDNTTNLGPGNGGGYAVFGWIVGPGMTVVDKVAATPTFQFADPFGQVPLTNFTQDNFNNKDDPLPHLVTITSATVVKTHPSFQNPFSAFDVDNNGIVAAQDVLVIINDLLAHSTHAVTTPFSGTNYVDANGDGKVSPQDVLKVINHLLGVPGSSAVSNSLVADPSALPMALSSASIAAVPEPSSLALTAAATLALGGYAVRRRLRRPRRTF